MREGCSRRGVDFLAAPVSGNGKVLASGGLSLVVSGPEQTYQRVAPLLRQIGKSVTYVGDGDSARLEKICHNIFLGAVTQSLAEIKVPAEDGDSARMVKICHNIFLGVVPQSLADITVLAEKGGVPRSAFLDFLNNSVMGSVFTRYKTPAFVNLDYTPTFTPILLRKDFDLGLAVARELDVPMPLAAITAQLVQASVSSGRVTEDFAILLDLQAASAGLKLTPEDIEVDDGLGGTDPS